MNNEGAGATPKHPDRVAKKDLVARLRRFKKMKDQAFQSEPVCV